MLRDVSTEKHNLDHLKSKEFIGSHKMVIPEIGEPQGLLNPEATTPFL